MRCPSRGVFLAAACLAASCASPPGAPPPAAADAAAAKAIALHNPGFEEDYPGFDICPPGWSCVVHADPFAFRFYLDEAQAAQGRRSLCIEPKGREPWGKAVQAMPDGPWHGKRVRFSMLVRIENVAHTQEGMGAGIFAFAHTAAPSNPVPTKRGLVQLGSLVRSDKLIHGTADWQRLSVELDVPADTNVLEVGVTLIGTGRVCADDAVLELL